MFGVSADGDLSAASLPQISDRRVGEPLPSHVIIVGISAQHFFSYKNLHLSSWVKNFFLAEHLESM